MMAQIVARTFSLVFYPLFIPTYGIALFCYAVHSPIVWAVVAIVGTLLFTCVLPMISIGILIKHGKVKDIQIENASERTMPYIYTMAGFAFWSYLMASVLHAPQFLTLVCIGATVAISIVALINRHWKISAHLTGIGGLAGGLMSYFVSIHSAPSVYIIILWLLVPLLMMFARLCLDAHTSAQVIAGWLLGLICTCVPNCIIAYVEKM